MQIQIVAAEDVVQITMSVDEASRLKEQFVADLPEHRERWLQGRGGELEELYGLLDSEI